MKILIKALLSIFLFIYLYSIFIIVFSQQGFTAYARLEENYSEIESIRDEIKEAEKKLEELNKQTSSRADIHKIESELDTLLERAYKIREEKYHNKEKTQILALTSALITEVSIFILVFLIKKRYLKKKKKKMHIQ